MLFAGVGDEVLMVEVHKLVVLLGQAFGGLVTKKLSDSERFFTWCITPVTSHRHTSACDQSNLWNHGQVPA